MRGLKSTIALIVVLVGLGAYIYFVMWKKTDADTGSKQEKVFASVDAAKVDEIKVKSEKGDQTTVKRESGTWQVVQPIAARADDSEVTGIANSLAQIEVTRVVDENPTSLKEYGLDPPRIAIDFKQAGDKTDRKLLLGDKSPTGSDMFAKRNDEKKVFLIPAFQESTFNKGTFDLRDKTIMKFERDKVDNFEVIAGGHTLSLAKEGGDWKIANPVQAKADFGAVEGLLGRISSAQMKSIAADNPSPADLKKYGLDKPEAAVNINAGSAKATLLVGGKAEDNTVYARDASKPVVVTVENSLLDELKKGPDDFRRKDLFEFRAFNADRLEITRDGQTVAFEKVKSQGQNGPDKWRRVSPNAGDVDKDKFDGLLSRLSNMRATSFVDSAAKTGLDKPAMTVFVKFDEGKKEERVSFAKSGEDVYASRSGEPGAAKTDASDFNEAMKTLDELSK